MSTGDQYEVQALLAEAHAATTGIIPFHGPRRTAELIGQLAAALSASEGWVRALPDRETIARAEYVLDRHGDPRANAENRTGGADLGSVAELTLSLRAVLALFAQEGQR